MTNSTDHVFIFQMSSIFSSNSEAFASEQLENLEEMIPRYYMRSNKFSTLIFYLVIV